MMASFSDSIDNPSQPIIEKKRCLRGMKEMIQIAKNDIAIAVPQVCVTPMHRLQAKY